MRYKQEEIKRNGLPRVISLVIVLLILLVPTLVKAAQYYVWGRVYSAAPLAEDEEAPPNPLTGIASNQILGDSRYACKDHGRKILKHQ